MTAEIDRLSVMVSLTDDERYHVKLRWGDFRAEFPHSEYPEDAAHTLWDWGYRGTFFMRWPDGSVATYVKANKRPGTQQATAAPRGASRPNTAGHTKRRLLPRCFRALGRETLFDVVQAGRG